MKSLITNIWKGPITTLLGLSLFVFCLIALYNDKIEFIWNGLLMVGSSIALLVLNESQITDGLTKIANAAIDKFKGGGGPIVPIIFLALIFSACTTTKNVSKSDDKSSSKSDSTATVKKKEQETEKITEQIDTTALVKGSEIKASTPISSLKDNPVILEDQNQILTISEDSTGKLQVKSTIKDRKVAVKFKKEIERKINTESITKIEEKKEAKHEDKAIQKDVKRSFALPWWLWLLIIGLIVLTAVVMKLKNKFSIF